MNELKYKSNKVLSSFFFCYLLCILGSFGIRLRWIFLLMFVVAFFFWSCFGVKCRIVQFRILLKWGSFVFFISLFTFLPNARRDSDVYVLIICLFVLTWVLLLCCPSDYEIKKMNKYIVFFALLFSIYISFFRIFSNLYVGIVVPYLSVNLKDKIINALANGYGPAIGNSFTFADSIIMLGIAVLVGMDISTKRLKISYKLLMLILLIGMVMEGRKGEFFCALLAILCSNLIHLKLGKVVLTRKKLVFIFFIIIVLVGLLVIFNNLGFFQRFKLFFQRLLSNNTVVEDISSGRLSLWKNAIMLFKRHPVIGAGWGRFANYTTGVYREVYEGQSIKDVHNCYLQLLCEVGIIGSFTILIPIFSFFKKTIKHSLIIKRNQYNNNLETTTNIFSLTYLFYFVFLIFIDPALYNPYLWCAVFLVIIYESFSGSLQESVG